MDADPQCNLTAFYLDERVLDELLSESNEEEGGNTVWSSVRPVVRGRGGVAGIDLTEVGEGEDGAKVWLAPRDVLLADYEEELAGTQTIVRERHRNMFP